LTLTESNNTQPLFTVVIPTYNEADNIKILIPKLVNILESSGFSNFEILVVDDDSPDGTCLIVREFANSDSRIRCLLRRKNKGLATAILRGIAWARGKYVVVMDADLQHPPELVPKLVSKAVSTGADVVVATRYAPGGGVEGWSRFRLLMSKTAILVSKILVPGTKSTSDPMSGFFLVKKSIVDPSSLRPRGYKILMEILEKSPYQKVEEVPYTFRNRAYGKSKLGAKTIIDFLIHAMTLSPLVKFASVGALGAVLNLTIMALLLLLGAPIDLASIAGIEISILFNFIFHEYWTFKTNLEENWLRRLWAYHLSSLGGIITTFTVMKATTMLGLLGPLAGQALGIVTGFAANYVISLDKVWRRSILNEIKKRRISASSE